VLEEERGHPARLKAIGQACSVGPRYSSREVVKGCEMQIGSRCYEPSIASLGGKGVSATMARREKEERGIIVWWLSLGKSLSSWNEQVQSGRSSKSGCDPGAVALSEVLSSAAIAWWQLYRWIC